MKRFVMRKTLVRALMVASVVLGSSPILAQTPTPKPMTQTIPLKSASRLPQKVGLDDQVMRDRRNLIRAIDHSLQYLQTPKAIEVYQKYPVKGMTRDRVERSLRRFRTLLLTARSSWALQRAIQREFVVYQSVGKDNQGTVAFTGYFEPVHAASLVPTSEYRYPLYRLPTGFSNWKKPHPTRLELEGEDGLQASKGLLRGSELVWMRDRLEAFLIQVQGSARLTLSDGKTMTIGVAGLTDQPYSGIGRELVKDGKLKLEDLNLPNVVKHFQNNPADLNVYLPRNKRFVFFRNTQGAPALGSLGVPVIPERSIATDKKLLPPGALALIHTQLPVRNPRRELEQQLVSRYVVDQDTGGAIIGAGRVDVFMGTGKQAGEKAGLVNSTGQLYYLLLKN
jgi:membrane-bound lytic murein transglycosylase A